MLPLRLAVTLLAVALLATPALVAAQSQAAVTGTVVYRERIALPPTAKLTVRLQDVSRADAPAVTIAEQVIDTAGQGPPYAYSLSYDPAQIQDNLTYAVRAEIRDGDQLLFTSTQSYQVITRGNPTSDIEILVSQVGGSGSDSGATTPTTLPATGEGDSGAQALLLLAAAALLGGLFARRMSR
jgi:uncharacterized lipoprotein YbaY